MITRMLQRRGTAAEWTAANPILSDGEFGYAKDTGVIKIGNGITRWASLPAAVEPSGLAAGTLTTLDSRYAGAGSAVGSRLAVASLATGITVNSISTTFLDMPGLTIAPVIGTRGVDVDVSLPVAQSSVNQTFVIGIFDATGTVSQLDQGLLLTNGAGWGSCAFKYDINPPAGSRTFKLMVKCLSGTANLSIYGADAFTRSTLSCTQR